ncbi:MAG: hypothetical protein GMKNLPBB_00356 [Myxococcota bacterium]|nr:hypothetical protein [Myxococcota bacterium]
MARKTASTAHPSPGAPDQRIKKILRDLSAMGSKENRIGMARYGINTQNAFGVSVNALRKYAKGLGRDHQLALALWDTGKHEARLLACFVDNPREVTEAQMESWIAGFNSWDLCDQACMNLFDRTPYAWSKAAEWMRRTGEWEKRAGFALAAALAMHDKTAPDDRFIDLLGESIQWAFDERNFVRKAVSWALRNTGKRNRKLNQAMTEIARDLLARANHRAGGERGGTAEIRAARQIANDVLRELTSEKTRARLKK